MKQVVRVHLTVDLIVQADTPGSALEMAKRSIRSVVTHAYEFNRCPVIDPDGQPLVSAIAIGPEVTK